MLFSNDHYYAQTGGSLENMRNSTTIQKVRQYHKKIYRAENLIWIHNIHLRDHGSFSLRPFPQLI
jgi:Zn-dependent M16 (insulinase) family peptidase